MLQYVLAACATLCANICTSSSPFPSPLICSLVVEDHERWVEHEWQQDVRCKHDSEWHGGSDTLDLPSLWCEAAEVNHAAYERDGEEVHPLERLEDLVIVVRIILTATRNERTSLPLALP